MSSIQNGGSIMSVAGADQTPLESGTTYGSFWKRRSSASSLAGDDSATLTSTYVSFDSAGPGDSSRSAIPHTPMSPGGRHLQTPPSTDYCKRRSRKTRSVRFCSIVTSVVIISAIGTLFFFLVPRSVVVTLSSFDVTSATFGTNVTRSVDLLVSPSLSINNPNYIPVTLTSLTLSIDVVCDSAEVCDTITLGSFTTTLKTPFEVQPRTYNEQYATKVNFGADLSTEDFTNLQAICTGSSAFQARISGSVDLTHIGGSQTDFKPAVSKETIACPAS